MMGFFYENVLAQVEREVKQSSASPEEQRLFAYMMSGAAEDVIKKLDAAEGTAKVKSDREKGEITVGAVNGKEGEVAMSREKGEKLTVEKLTGGWLVTWAYVSPSSPPAGAPVMIYKHSEAETRLAAARQALVWLGFDLPRIEEALSVMKACTDDP